MNIGKWEMGYKPTSSANTPLPDGVELINPIIEPKIAKCKFCGKDLPDGGCVTVEADEGFMEKHLDDEIPIVFCYHKRCFEEHFKVTLPVFDESQSPRAEAEPSVGGASDDAKQ